MNEKYSFDSQGNIICHYRTPGSKNGVRLYQNEDGSYTELGKNSAPGGRYNQHHSDGDTDSGARAVNEGNPDNYIYDTVYTSRNGTRSQPGQIQSWQVDCDIKNMLRDPNTGELSPVTGAYLASQTGFHDEATHQRLHVQDNDLSIGDMKNINYNGAMNCPGRANNCTKCTCAALLHLKYNSDVMAGCALKGCKTNWYETMFPGSRNAQQWKYGSSVNGTNFADALVDRWPAMRHGNVDVRWGNGSGHSMMWATDAYGNMRVYDGQGNECITKDSSSDYAWRLIKETTSITFTDLTDYDVDWDAVAAHDYVKVGALSKGYDENVNVVYDTVTGRYAKKHI